METRLAWVAETTGGATVCVSLGDEVFHMGKQDAQEMRNQLNRAIEDHIDLEIANKCPRINTGEKQ